MGLRLLMGAQRRDSFEPSKAGNAVGTLSFETVGGCGVLVAARASKARDGMGMTAVPIFDGGRRQSRE